MADSETRPPEPESVRLAVDSATPCRLPCVVSWNLYSGAVDVLCLHAATATGQWKTEFRCRSGSCRPHRDLSAR
jgi:hypothetical protein